MLALLERIASICAEAQEEIRRANLDDVQTALLEIANEPPEKQVEKAREVKERYRKPRRKRVTNADIAGDRGATGPNGGKRAHRPRA
jgi:hypothetical protein